MSRSAYDPHNPHEDKALWALLGRGRQIEVSPFFARKVLRAVESVPAGRNWWGHWLRAFLPATACVALAGLALASLPFSDPAGPWVHAEIEFETIRDLDLLVSNAESSLWLDPSSPSPY